MIFEPIKLTWKGAEFTIAPDRVLGCIAQIEEVLPIGELARLSVGDLKLAKLSRAFAVALRYAGAQVSDEEVYSGLFTDLGGDMYVKARAYVFALQAMMLPPEHLRKAGKEAAAAERAGSSRKRTSSLSAKAG